MDSKQVAVAKTNALESSKDMPPAEDMPLASLSPPKRNFASQPRLTDDEDAPAPSLLTIHI